MAFKDLDEVLSPVEPLVLPRRGKDYSFPGEISADTWLKVQRLGARAVRAAKDPNYKPSDEAVSDVDQDTLLSELCGPALDEMTADGFTNLELSAVLGTLIAFHFSGREQAEAIWNNSGNPPAPNRATRRKAATQ